MDATTVRLVDFALQSEFGALSAETVHECKRRLIDTIGCAIGAFDEPLSLQARAVAKRISGDPAASVWGSNLTSSPETAAFANGVMLRLMDISDTYLGKSRGHPSDVISGVLAVGESVRAGGPEIIAATVLAYDVYCSLCDAIDWNTRGWDQPVYAVLGTVIGAGKLLVLSREQMGHAVALALVANMAMTQTRRGPLSSWKGCAGANASRNAVFAALLARDGFTGPSAIFEGEGGLFDIVGRFDWSLPSNSHMIEQTHIKSLPVCYHGQSAVLAALKLRAQLQVAEIAEVRVEAYRAAVDMMGNDPSRWAPTTHETADHSLPYTVAIALLDGAVTAESFALERFTDPAVVALMRKTKVCEDSTLTAAYPEGAPGRVTVTMNSGEVHDAELKYPDGHAQNPLSDAQVEDKFRQMFSKRRSQAHCEQVLQRLWQMERVGDSGREVFPLLRA
jgi:2-methylcitrate dehydratase